MQRVNNWDLRIEERPVNGRRDHHKGVVNVDDVWFLPQQQFAKFTPRVAGPDGSLGECKLVDERILAHLMITPVVFQHLVPGTFQEIAFLMVDEIFAARLLIGVMDKNNLHTGSGLACNYLSACSITRTLPLEA